MLPDTQKRPPANVKKNKTDKPTKPCCIALIGDLVGSRTLGQRRAHVQEKLFEILHSLNNDHAEFVLAKFIVTAGDEFQGLLLSGVIIPEIIWDVETKFDYQVRFGIGIGPLSTPLQEYAVGMDGPAWYDARDAILDAHTNKRMGGVFKGFSPQDDCILNGFARTLGFQRAQFTDKQIRVIEMLRGGKSQTEIAQKLKITRQAVSDHLVKSGWSAYSEGEHGWKTALTKYDFTQDWKLKR
jgi:hypothetical protein